jgi:23S rRNA (guanosine2251-2'-O)-methyltransferase
MIRPYFFTISISNHKKWLTTGGSLGRSQSESAQNAEDTLLIMQLLYGLHAVEEAIRSGNRRLESVVISRQRQDVRLIGIAEACRVAGIPVRVESKDQLTRLAHSEAHQGVVAVVAERGYSSLEELAQRGEHDLFLLALDGVEDPHNLGALLRTADGAGADGVVLPERRAAGVNATVVKTSAGAAEHVRIARVTNLVRALEELKRQNVWCIGLDERGSVDYDRFDYRCNFVLVLGGEGSGLHELTRRTCDHLLRIPMAGQVPSLNVSVAGAIVMYEAARQRRAAIAWPAIEKTGSAAVLAKRPLKGLGS